MDVSADQIRLVEELIQRHQSMVRGYLSYLGCPVHLLDDLIQDVFLSVLSSRFEHRADASTAVFLRKVAQHLFLKAMHRERRQPMALEPSVAEAAWVVFEGEDAGESYLAALEDCLRKLETRAAEVIRLRYKDGLRRNVIGETLGLSEAGVKSILVRARRALRECVERKIA